MKFARIAALLLWALPSFAAVPRAMLPSSGLGISGYSGSAAAAATPSLAPALPALPAPSLAPPSLQSAPLPAALDAAPAAASPAAAPLEATGNSLVRAPDLAAGLAALRAASFETHPEVEAIVARIKTAHPELPISAENLFIVRDAEILKRLEIPEAAAGAARILTDGRREVPVVILVAANGVGLDEFVEFAVHEAVHLMDDGILRVSHDAELKHFFAEGWTQKRAVVLANEVLAGLGRPATPGKAYRDEIVLTDAFIARHGTAALDELVRTGSDAGLRRALGADWELASRLVSGDGGRPGSSERRLQALIALVDAEHIGPDEERALLAHVRR